MTKKDLERRNKFLLLELKKISVLTDIDMLSFDDICRNIGVIHSLSNFEDMKRRIEFIEEHNLDYNFYDKEMDIDDYIC